MVNYPNNIEKNMYRTRTTNVLHIIFVFMRYVLSDKNSMILFI